MMSLRRWMEYSATLSNNTMSLAANAGRRGVVISNNSDTVMTFRVNATATASLGVSIPAGTAVDLTGTKAPEGSISVFCAGSSKACTIYELVG